MSLKAPKVSVCIMAYNQEKYIRKCIESLIEQNCTFDYEIVISDDCSTDNTAKIIRELHKKNPDKIRAYIQEKRLGVKYNYLFLHGKALGEYIAHIDGDDYCFPNKLSNQAKYLDENKECNIVWHPMLLDNGRKVFNGYQQKDTDFSALKFYRADIIQYISVGKNSSKMYRKIVRNIDIPSFDLVDYLVNVEQVKDGYGAYSSNEPLGVYRVGIGISSTGDKTRIALRDSFHYILDKYPQYRLEVNTAVLTYLIRDVFCRKRTALVFLRSWIKTFHPFSLLRIVTGMKTIKKLKYRA